MMVKDSLPPIDRPSDIINGTFERKLHIPKGTAYEKMFPASPTDGESCYVLGRNVQVRPTLKTFYILFACMHKSKNSMLDSSKT